MRQASFIFNSKAKRVISILLVILLLVSGIWFLNRVFLRDSSRYKYKPFLEEDTDYDVLFFGTSHVINGIFPMQLWKDYGITSYNFGGHGNSIAASYWAMKNAIAVHKPRIAVLDVYFAGANSAKMDISQAHLSFDAIPLNLNKIRAAADIFSEDSQSRNELIFPLSVYHNRWTELNSDMVKSGFGKSDAGCEKGAESRIAVAVPDEMRRIDEAEMLTEETVALQYIRKFIDYCRAEDIEPVLINIPYPANEDSQKAANAAMALAEEEGVPAINFQYLELVDFDTDCYDPNSHLNPSGARKVTAYLGSFLKKEYSLTDHRDDTRYSTIWDQDYEDYHNFLKEKILSNNDLKVELMLLNNENFIGELYVRGMYKLDPVEEKLLKQVEDTVTVKRVSMLRSNDGGLIDMKLCIRDAESGELLAERMYKMEQTLTVVSADR